MPQHAVSASQGPFEDVNTADRQSNALPDAHHDAHTFSPPLAGNDVSPFGGAVDHRISDAAARAEGDSGEEPRDGNNDNIPSGQALVILDSSTDVAAAGVAAIGQGARTNVRRTVVAVGVLAVGLGGVFAYSGSGEQTKISPSRMELASIPAAAPTANTAAPSSLPFEANTVAPLRSAPEINTAPITAAPPDATPVPAATAQPQSVLPPASVLEEKAAVLAPEATPQSSAALPAPALAAAEPVPALAAAEPTAREEMPAAAVTPQITPNNLSAATPAQPTRSVTPPPAGPARGQFVFVQRPNVNIRNAPSDRGQIIGIAQFGGRFVVARSDGEWMQVAQGPWRGWIKSRFLGSRLPRG